MELVKTIPEELLNIDGLLVIEAGFATGPAYMATKYNKFDPPVPIENAVSWLEEVRHIFTAAHLRLNNETVLMFHPSGFKSLHREPEPDEKASGLAASRIEAGLQQLCHDIFEADTFASCSACCKSIKFGNATVSFSCNFEQVNRDECSGERLVTTIRSEPLLQLCADCGNFDLDSIRDQLFAVVLEELADR